MKNDQNSTAEKAIQATGARTTAARTVVLQILMQAERALTQAEVESRLPHAQAVDRVTIYRVLEWLTTQQLAHKIQGNDRQWRFNSAVSGNSSPHAHFHCSDCSKVVCLEDVFDKPAVKVPVGFEQKGIEITVTGLCSHCSA